MADIEICMDIPHGTLHQIEGEYHLLPHFQRGLGKWLRDFLRCVKATPEEVEAVRHLASRVILMEFGDDLD